MSEQPNPYRFTVSVERWETVLGDSRWDVLLLRKDDPEDEHTARDVMFVAEFDTEAEARAHAALVVAALHQAVMEGQPPQDGHVGMSTSDQCQG